MDNFKEVAMIKSEHVRKYYLNVEKIFYSYLEYTNNYNINLEKNKLKEKDEEMLKLSSSFKNQLSIKDDELKNKNQEVQNLQVFKMNITNFINNVKEKTKNGYIYIATCKRYAEINNFKVGKTDNLIQRLADFNSSHNSQDLFYMCYYEKVFEYSKVENLIHSLLDNFRDKKDKEIFILHYKYLLELIKICIKNINEPFDYINDLIKNKLSDMYNLKSFIPEPLTLNNQEIIIEDLKKLIIKLLDECIDKNKLQLNRKELLNRLNLENSNKIELWNNVKKLLNWKSSKIPILYKNSKLIISY